MPCANATGGKQSSTRPPTTADAVTLEVLSHAGSRIETEPTTG